MTVSEEICSLLRSYAEKYETEDFIKGDPSWFMHRVSGEDNQETMAFLASSLSYGSRSQFLPKIDFLLKLSNYEPYSWIKNGSYNDVFHQGDARCYYRLYTYHDMWCFFTAYNELLHTYGTLREFVNGCGSSCAKNVIELICKQFALHSSKIIPKNTISACKRICMFLRWMVRDNSPVDLGIWSDILDKKTLIIPLDTHVLTEACELGLVASRNASMQSAIKLTAILSEIFPDDPTKGDFALFGYGVNKGIGDKS